MASADLKLIHVAVAVAKLLVFRSAAGFHSEALKPRSRVLAHYAPQSQAFDSSDSIVEANLRQILLGWQAIAVGAGHRVH
jgi:hypothetical protein